jgi:hypothetical protein
MNIESRKLLRVFVHGFFFGLSADTVGLIAGGWVYKYGLLFPAIGYPLAMATYYILRPRLRNWINYLALGIYALATEMTYTISGDPNKIIIGDGWMPRAIFVWPLITLVYYAISVDLPEYLRKKMKPKLAEVISVALQTAYAAGFVMLYMKVLAFML